MSTYLKLSGSKILAKAYPYDDTVTEVPTKYECLQIEIAAYMNHLNGCNMTVHRDYANKSCPGDYLYNRHGEIAEEVNRRLGAAVDTPTEDKPTTSSVKAGDTVKIFSMATYYGGKTIPAWVKAKNWIVREVSGDRTIIDKSVDGKNAICSPVNTKYLSVVSAASTLSQSAWTPQVGGDYVSFTGKTHYASSNGDRAVSCRR